MQETLHNQLLDSVPDGVFTVDADWRITFFNRAAEQITGIRRQEALASAVVMCSAPPFAKPPAR